MTDVSEFCRILSVVCHISMASLMGFREGGTNDLPLKNSTLFQKFGSIRVACCFHFVFFISPSVSIRPFPFLEPAIGAAVDYSSLSMVLSSSSIFRLFITILVLSNPDSWVLFADLYLSFSALTLTFLVRSIDFRADLLFFWWLPLFTFRFL